MANEERQEKTRSHIEIKMPDPPLLFLRKQIVNIHPGRSSGLATAEHLPIPLSCETVAEDSAVCVLTTSDSLLSTTHNLYSYGDSTGFTPVSLLISTKIIL